MVSVPNTDAGTRLSFLGEAAQQEFAALLEETHPQVVVAAIQNAEDEDAALFFVICTQLKGDPVGDAIATRIGKIFAMLPFDRRVSVAEKVTTTEIVDAERARQIWDEQLANIKETRQHTTFLGDGSSNLAKLLSYMDIAEQDRLLEALAVRRPGVVGNVSEKLFTFENLSGLGDEAIKTILQVLDKPTTALALHNAPTAIRDRFFENMSASQSEAVAAEIEQLTFEQTQLADTARQSVVSLVRNFAAKGLLKIG